MRVSESRWVFAYIVLYLISLQATVCYSHLAEMLRTVIKLKSSTHGKFIAIAVVNVFFCFLPRKFFFSILFEFRGTQVQV